jgi:hypothetical protein
VREARDRFFDKIEFIPFHECWEWIGSKNPKGYGNFNYKNKTTSAHRVMFELTYGSVDKDLDVDHICRNRGCVNPRHLRQVTHKQNILENSDNFSALNKKKSSCPKGHPYDYFETGRRCRQCRREVVRKAALAWYHRNKAK